MSMNEQKSAIQEPEILADQQNWDEGWSEAAETPESSTHDNATAAEPEASEPAPEESDSSVQAEANGAEQEHQKPANQPTEVAPEEPFLVLKHLDETRGVNREEAQQLAQKGMDYDRVRERMEGYKRELDDAKPALALVKQYAARMNLSVADYLDYCRTQELMGGGMSEEQAKNQVKLDRREAELTAKEAAAEEAEQARKRAEESERANQERVERDLADFVRRFPGVKAESIQQSIWDAVRKGDSLVVAYTQHQLAEANKELAALKASEESRKLTPGSLAKTEHKPTVSADPFDEDWYRDD